MVRGESHRATYKIHHFQPSRIYETGSRLQENLAGKYRVSGNCVLTLLFLKSET